MVSPQRVSIMPFPVRSASNTPRKAEASRVTTAVSPPRVPDQNTAIAPPGAQLRATAVAPGTTPVVEVRTTETPAALPTHLPARVPDQEAAVEPLEPPEDEEVEIVRPMTPVLPANARSWSFDNMSTGARVTGFQRQGGRWFIRPDASAPSSPHVYAQLSRSKAEKVNPGAVYKGRTHTNFTCAAAIRILPESTAGGGIIFRHRDMYNYYALELDANEGTLKLLLFVSGREAVVGAPVPMDVVPNQWYNLMVECQNDQLTCYVDGQPMMSVMEGSLATGHVGLWARRGTVAYFLDRPRHHGPQQRRVPVHGGASRWFHPLRIPLWPRHICHMERSFQSHRPGDHVAGTLSRRQSRLRK